MIGIVRAPRNDDVGDGVENPAQYRLAIGPRAPRLTASATSVRKQRLGRGQPLDLRVEPLLRFAQRAFDFP